VVSNHKLQKMVKVKLNFKVTQFTELTDAQWAIIEKIVDTGRKIKKDLRMIVNCILKVTRTGCQWRNIDEKYGPWQSIYYYFRKWVKNGILGDIMSHIVQKERVRQGRDAEASASAIDSQSVKKVGLINLDTGIDFVCAANIQDGIAGIELLPLIEKSTKRLKLIRADKAYRSDFTEAAQWCGYAVEVSQKPPTEKGFVPQTGRWQVERSFAWENFYRRLSKDYEKTVDSSVAFIQLAFISIILSKF
jgi:putative transposase